MRLLLLFLVLSGVSHAQKTRFYTTPKDMNHWSVEGFWGTSSALSNLPQSSDPKKITFIKPTVQARYMFNQSFGLQLGSSFEFFRSVDMSMNGFKTVNLRASLQGVWNIGRTFNFEKRSPNFSLLWSLGGGMSSLRDGQTKWLQTWRNNHADEKLNVISTLSAQFRYSDRVVFYVAPSFVTHYQQDADFNLVAWDLNPKKIQGHVFNLSVGISYYFGEHQKHVDWYFETPKLPTKDPDIRKEEKKELIVMDRDHDGIVDSLDKCPDVKGLLAYQGCPPPEPVVECFMDEFPIILFENSSAIISQSNKLLLDSVANCLKNNPDQKLIIHGYTDNIGDPVSIEDLSYRRALNVKRELTQNGIDKDRLLALSEGATKPELPDSIYRPIGHNRLAYFEIISNNAYDIQELSTNKSLQGLFYTIQVGAYEQTFDATQLNELGRVLYSKSPNKKILRYSIGVFLSPEEAQKALENIQQKGMYKDAFVTAYYLGERISNKRAKSIFSQKGAAILEKQ